MEYTREERAYLWLFACTELDYRTRVSVLRAARDPARLFSGFPVENTEGDREQAANEFLARLAEKGYFAVTLISEDYPEALKAIPDPPLVLYGAGNRALLKRRKFCIVGSRVTPPWAEQFGKTASAELAKSFAVVTGLAEGGDSAAIAGAISSGNLICVLPCGLNECYPASHASLKEKIRKNGLLLSEYLPCDPASKYAFHARNRILAGLSEGVLVLSAGERSGALITANRAAEYGRDVFALPYSLGTSRGAGCNELIKRGAFLVTEVEDVLSVYGIEHKLQRETAFTPQEERVLEVLRTGGEVHLAEVAEKAGLLIFEAAAILSALELKGAAVKSGGNRFAAVRS